MTARTEEKLVTAEELGRMRLEEACELVDGRIVKRSPAGMWHGIVIGKILELLSEHVKSKGLGLVTSGETGFRTRRDPDRVRAPDLAFVSNEKLARAKAANETFFPEAPDLAVEVLSPDDSWEKIEEKVREYLAAGAKLVWVASPTAEKVYIYEPGSAGRVLGREDELQGATVLPGFRARVASIFTT